MHHHHDTARKVKEKKKKHTATATTAGHVMAYSPADGEGLARCGAESVPAVGVAMLYEATMG
jgi:hypothetical protein